MVAVVDLVEVEVEKRGGMEWLMIVSGMVV